MMEHPRHDTLMGRVGAADNLSDPVPNINKRETILGLCISFTVLSWLCVAFRLYTRLRLIRSPGWDDLFVVLSLLTMTIGLVSICVSTEEGLGKHLLHLTDDQVSAFLHSFYVFNASYCMSTALIKISLLLQFNRLYRRGTLLYNICYGFIIFIALWGVAYSIIAWVPCVPVSDYWTFIYDKGASPVRCYGYGSHYVKTFTATYESHAAINMVLDLVVMALPIPLYFEAGAPGRTKMGLVAVLTMGAIVNVFSIWRFATTIKHKAATHPTFDPTWYGAVTVVMAGLETASACICASIPVFWGPLLASATQLLGQIFVTKEVCVTHEHRFENLGSNDGFQNLEMQGAGTAVGIGPGGFGMPDFGHQQTGSRLEWEAKSGLRQHYETWSK